MVEVAMNISRQQLEDAIIILDMLCLSNLMDDHKKETREILLTVFRNVWKKELGNVPQECPTCHKKLDTEMIG